MQSSVKYIFFLILIWAVSIIVVNPLGEFMVNDDHAFIKNLETLSQDGQLGPTGWGPEHASGGPSLITHLAWGLLFTKLFGHSITALRFSILSLGILGSVGIFLIVRSLMVPEKLAFIAALSLMFNPLYFSQSFTFMSDITFTSIIIFAVYFLNLGVKRSNTGLLVVGMLFCLAGMLTRQLAIALPTAFILTSLLGFTGRELSRTRAVGLTLALVIIPWLGFEVLMSWLGSSPITKHQKLYNLLNYPMMKGFPDYPLFVAGQFAQSVLGYTAFLVSPLLVIRLDEFRGSKPFRVFFVVTTLLFGLLEIAIVTGVVTPPILFSRNVIYNIGIGPVLLKDVYIMGIPRTWALTPALFYILAWWTVICVGALLSMIFKFVMEIFRTWNSKEHHPDGFISALTLTTALMYAVIISLTDLHDRYIIPLCALMAVWLCSSAGNSASRNISTRLALSACAPLILTAVFSLTATRDFMEIRRTVQQANHFIVTDLKVKPCEFDGGFEFNGYHCYGASRPVREGYSWWWVHDEKYVVTLGDLAGYTTVKVFPFKRTLGPNGNVHVLKPL